MGSREARGWVTLLVLLASGCGAGTVLFEDAFTGYPQGSTGEPLWRLESGTWTVTPEGFVGKDGEGHFTASGAHAGRREWTDYTLTLELKLTARGKDWRDGPWIGVRYQDSRNAYTVGFYSRMTALHKASAGQETRDGSELATSPFVLTDSTWHRLAIRVQGPQIAVSVDGQAVIDGVDADWGGSPPVPCGAIVLGARSVAPATGSTAVVFRKLKVEALGEAPASLVYTAARARQEARPRTSVFDFMRAKRERRGPRVPHKVLAFYYTWYGTPERHGQWVHWENVRPAQHDIASATHFPALGAYDSHDPAVIAGHLRQAKAAGVDGFITTWWGQGSFDDRILPTVLAAAAQQGLEATVYWETAPGKDQAQVDQAVRDLAYVITTHGQHPAFLKVEGKPVIFVYGRVMGQVPLSRWPDIINGARAAAGQDFLLLADGYSEVFARLFDGIHTYNIVGEAKGKTPDELRQWAAGSFPTAVGLAKRHAGISCLTIIPGYDDTKIRTPGLKAERHDGAAYRVLWEEAIRADPDWVLITSWNEWHEGSEIEPSWEDGERYLNLTGEFAPRFKSKPFSQVPTTPAAAGGVSPERVRALQERFRGTSVGLLPDAASDAAFWLAESGIAYRELTWEEVAAPAGVTPARFPVVLYAAGEHYVQSLERERDVDDGLVRYLRAGGLLLCLPAMPFPFYYNERGQPVANAATFGIPIGGSGAFARDDVLAGARTRGWEEPPPGVTLSFRFDRTALPGLPATAPFPAAGDQRWRPAVQHGLAPEDIYLPLARLTDAAGNDYGDGIAYIEHRRSEPLNGKALYAWMRLPDVANKDEIMFAIFRLAAEHMAQPATAP